MSELSEHMAGVIKFGTFGRLRGLRSRHVILALATVSLGVAFASFWVYQSRLQAFQSTIAVQFADEIAAVEAGARAWRDPDVPENHEFNDELRSNLRRQLASHEVNFAELSFDGHHGVRSIKPLPEGFYQAPFCRVEDGRNHKLCYGSSFSGQRMLIYHLWIPEGRVMQRAMLVFRQDAVARKLAASDFK